MRLFAALVVLGMTVVAFAQDEMNPKNGGRLSGKATDGNTQNQSFLIAGAATCETDADLMLLKAVFRYGKCGQTLTEYNSYGIGWSDLKFTPAVVGVVREELSGDTVKDLSLGTITRVGAGDVLLKESGIDLATETGIAFMSNDFQAARDESHRGWDLPGGVITEYDHTASPGLGRRDEAYFMGLG